MIIVLHWTDWLKDVRVYRFAAGQMAAANSYLDGLTSDRTGYAFDTAHSLPEEIESVWMGVNGASGLGYRPAALVEIFNALVKREFRVTTFSDRDTAFRRIAQVLVQRADASSELTPSILPKDPRRMSDAHQEAEPKKTRTRKTKNEPAAETAPKAPGVISSLVECLKNGGGTVEELANTLAERFPDRLKEGMTTTIRVQLVRLAKQGKLNIRKEKVEGRGLVYSGSAVE